MVERWQAASVHSRVLVARCGSDHRYDKNELGLEIPMDVRVFLTTFGVIFLAEMGDKTQLAAMTMAADSKKPWAVFLGASLALAAVSALGVLVGSLVGDYVPIEWVKRVAAMAFIVIGVLMLLGKF